MARILYLSYDGMLEPLGQSQVLAYLQQLASQHQIDLISFEKAHDWAKADERQQLADRIAAAGIRWHPLRYHKRPSALATAWDIFAGTALGLWLVVRHRVQIIHARSYVASVMALNIKRLTGRRFLFDMRGFWADERVDGGIWPAGSRLYRVAKGFEQRFLLAADAIVSLTHAAVREMQTFPYLQGMTRRFQVIPTCTNLALFRPLPRAEARPFTVGYVGSVGVWYLFDETLACFKALQQRWPEARLLVINREDHAFIAERVAAAGIDPQQVEIKAARHDTVAQEISRMDVGLFFIKPAYSKTASAPTKLGEFLGCGVPCLANAGVGDQAEVLRRGGVGIVVEQFTPEAFAQAAAELAAKLAEPDLAQRCVAVAQAEFSLEGGVAAYDALYRELTA